MEASSGSVIYTEKNLPKFKKRKEKNDTIMRGVEFLNRKYILSFLKNIKCRYIVLLISKHQFLDCALEYFLGHTMCSKFDVGLYLQEQLLRSF